MRRESLTVLVRNSADSRRVLFVAILLALAFVLAILMSQLRFPGSSTAPWWPASGLSVLAMLSARRLHWLILGGVTFLTAIANIISGTEWWISLLFGVAGAAETFVVYAIMRRYHSAEWSSRSGWIVRFVLATVLGGLVGGTIAAGTLVLVGDQFLPHLLSVSASHMSAIILIGSFGIVPLNSYRVRRVGELCIQFLLLLVTLAVVFIPGQDHPVAFLVFPVLAWAALRLGVGVVLIQVALVSVIAVVLGALGGGSFTTAAEDAPSLFVGLNQLFTLSLSISMLLLATLRDDHQAMLQHLRARAELLQGSLVSANAGFLLLGREDGNRFTVLEANPAFERLLKGWSAQTHDDGTRTLAQDLAELPGVTKPSDERWSGSMWWGTHQLELLVAPVGDERSTLLVQALDVTEERRAKTAMEQALRHERELTSDMRKLSVQKDEFVASVSHELRTPVTSILGYAEELEHSDLSEEDRELLEVVTRNARRLAHLIDDLLTLSQMSAATPYSPSAIDLGHAAREAVSDQAHAAATKHVSLNAVSAAPLMVLAGPLLLHRVMTNLVSNAIKFSCPGDSVTVRVETIGSEAVATIVDTGPGIDPQGIGRVFDRFYRIVDAESGHRAGTGLGLPIVRELMTRMSGSVWLDSDGKNGTTATVRLPLAAAAAQDQARSLE